ncbi:MAG: hypothetical protein JO303_18040 [Caulobacteraceae bacterium]|nr:hypothetical protein [Caulobacteraceae bacterium]
MRALIRWAAAAACALAPAPAFAALAVGPCQAALNLSPNTDGAVGADAALCSALAETHIKLTVEAHPATTPSDPLAPASNAFTSAETASFDTLWGDASGAHIALSAADKLGQITDLLSPVQATADHQVNTDERSASLALALPAWKALNLTLTGAQNERTVDDIVLRETVAKTQTLFDINSQSAGSDLKWTLPGGVVLDAKGRLEAASVSWRGTVGDAALGYGGFEPSLNATAPIPGGGKLGLTFEQAVSPIDSGALAAFAAAPGRAAGARFGPNREWRYRLDFNQPLTGGMTLTAALIKAQLESTTELGPVADGVQAPMAITGGDRSEADLTFTAPLALLGLPSFQFKGVGAWRASQIRDPFTGAVRSLSGESPQTATLDLTQSLPERRTRWGLEGRLGGDETLYQMSQVTAVNVAASLGGFVEYNPGAFALRLQVDGLYGGDRLFTDTYYSGVRGGGDSVIDRVDHRSAGSQAVRLILKKSL